MKISIALATYNGANYLEQQLASFVAQSRRPDELVITDDCSTDNTLEIIRRFAAEAPFPVVWAKNEANLGYGANFNAALMKTTGEFVFLSDQDDVWFPEKISRMVSIAEQDPSALVLINNAMLTDKSLHETGLTALNQIRSSGFGDGYFVMGCCAAVRREWLNVCLPVPVGRTHDSWIVGIAGEIGRKRIVPDVLQYYRRHDRNESRWIVNRTRRVTRWDVRVEAWINQWRSWRDRRIRVAADGARPSISRLEWARTALDRAPPGLRDDLRRWRAELERQEIADTRRREIRSLPLPRRSLAAWKFWRDGGYGRYSGVLSMARDIARPRSTTCRQA